MGVDRVSDPKIPRSELFSHSSSLSLDVSLMFEERDDDFIVLDLG